MKERDPLAANPSLLAISDVCPSFNERASLKMTVEMHTVFLRLEVAPKYRLPPIRSRIKPENFILKDIAYRISSNIGREITTENLQAADCI